jgi:methylated-DNA-protein-cysteine methyltransferase-like protein
LNKKFRGKGAAEEYGDRKILAWGQPNSVTSFRPREPDSAYERIYEAVRQIPPGKVATYGQIAKIVDRCTPRMVGYAMAALRGRTDVPWQRVINAKGEISARSRGEGALRQRKLLGKEGIRFDQRGRVDFKKYRWRNRGKTEDAIRP